MPFDLAPHEIMILALAYLAGAGTALAGRRLLRKRDGKSPAAGSRGDLGLE